MKSLIVEDEFVSRAKLQKILSAYGECHVAVNGIEGLYAFRNSLHEKQPYDLICMDILMPGLDGHETLKKIRQIEKELGMDEFTHVKVIMTTGLNDANNVMKAFVNGQCEAYLPKPVSRETLLDKLALLGLIKKSAK